MSAAEQAWRELMGVHADDPLLRREKANYMAGYQRALRSTDTITELRHILGVFTARAERDRYSQTGVAAIVLTYDDAAAVVRERIDALMSDAADPERSNR